MIRHVIDRYTQTIPAILEIPSKEHPYDATKDSILRRAKVHEYFSLLYVVRILDKSPCSSGKMTESICVTYRLKR